ncbi:MAG: hypothetical protein AAGF32_06465, partial [Pseudomonadota bacterium]
LKMFSMQAASWQASICYADARGAAVSPARVEHRFGLQDCQIVMPARLWQVGRLANLQGARPY